MYAAVGGWVTAPTPIYSPSMVLPLLLALSAPAAATEPHPRVCLALSGGGALGLAHVGVLQALEELRIPVDCIAGTSIGGLVGGLYATGMTADQIEAVVVGQDWARLFVDRPDRRDLSMRRKQDDFDFVSALTVGVGRGGVTLPLGLREGHRQNLFFEELTLPVADVTDFDALPIPYRAVAARLDDGAEVELSGGELAHAMRATMSIPGVFAPVEVDGVTLVDGGVADNLPVDNARAMGADVVIASWVDLPGRPENLVSASSAMVFSLLDRGSLETLQGLGPDDVRVTLDPGDTIKGDWTAGAKLIAWGHDQAMAALAGRTDLQRTPAEYAAWRASVTPPPIPAPVIAFIDLDNQSRYDDAVVLRRLNRHVGAPLDGPALLGDIDRIYGLGSMAWVSWRLVERDGQAGIAVEVREKPWGPNYLTFGIQLEAGLYGVSQSSLTLAHRRIPWNRWGGEWANELTLGETTAYATELYQPLGPSLRPFAALNGEVSRSYLREGQAASAFALGRVGLDLGVMPLRSLELRAGYHVTVEQIRPAGDGDWGDAAILHEPDLQRGYGQVQVAVRHDGLDDAWFPRNGTWLDVQLDAFRVGFGPGRGGDGSGEQLSRYAVLGEASVWGTPSFGGGRHTVSALAMAGTNWPLDRDPGGLGYSLGGLFRLSGLEPDARLDEELIFGRVGYRFRLMDGQVPTYLGVTAEAGRGDDADKPLFSSAELIFAGSAYLGVATPLGPLYLAYVANTRVRGHMTLVLGRVF